MRRWAVVALAVVAAAVLVTIAYQAGVSHGIALQPPAAVAPAAPGAAQAAPPPPPYPYYPYGYYGPRRGGFFGALLGIFLFLFVLRAFFWGLFGWGWRRRWRYYGYPDDGPSRFDEWHRRAHDRMRDDRGPAAPTNV
jgi:hypothetical protein